MVQPWTIHSGTSRIRIKGENKENVCIIEGKYPPLLDADGKYRFIRSEHHNKAALIAAAPVMAEVTILADEFAKRVAVWCEQQPEPVAFSAAMAFGVEIKALLEAITRVYAVYKTD